MALIFSKLFTLFSHHTDPEAVKKKLLKGIAKDINSSKYSKFYKTKHEEAEPALGRFFFDIYKVISPAQVFMQHAMKSSLLKQAVINNYLDKKALDLQQRLTWESIEERAGNTAPKELISQLREEFKGLAGALDTAKIQAVDSCYSLIIAFTQFVSFDFFSLLKKFDNELQEHSFINVPILKSVEGDKISDELKDFLEVAAALESDQEWQPVLQVLRDYKGGEIDVVGADQWKKLLANLQEVKQSRILECIIQHIDKNPEWQPVGKIPQEHIVGPWREAKKAEILEVINRITNAKRNAQIQELAKRVFVDGVKSRLKNYTEQGGDIFVKKQFEGFTYVMEMNYLKAFLLDCFKKDIRELCDFLLVRGQWKPTMSVPLSECFRALMTLSDKVLAFDDALGDTGTHGSRLKVALAKADRDQGQARYVKMILSTINGEVRDMLNQTAQALVTMGKNLKLVQDDYPKEIHLIITNWKELEANASSPLETWINDVYKKIYNFFQILQIFIQAIKGQSAPEE